MAIKEKGFTLVEMLVVLAVMAVLSAVVIANFPQVRLQFALSRSAYEFAQTIRKAQNLAISSVEYKDNNGVTRQISGYGVFVDTGSFLGNKKYIIYADTYPGNQQYDGLDYIVETVDLAANEQGVVVKEVHHTPGKGASINFTPPNPVTTLTQLNAGESSVEVVFALESNLNQTKTVFINQSGLVEVK